LIAVIYRDTRLQKIAMAATLVLRALFSIPYIASLGVDAIAILSSPMKILAATLAIIAMSIDV
jgi:hypothetical protein